MKNNLRRILEVVSVLALFVSINTISFNSNSTTEKPIDAIEFSAQANAGYAIYKLVDGNDVDSYVPEAALLGATGGAVAGMAAFGVGAGGTTLAAAQTGAKIGAIGGGLVGALAGAAIGAL
jgi:hypothetical protein